MPIRRHGSNPLLPLLALAVVIGLFTLLIFRTSEPVSFDDALRHMAMAKLLAARGILSVPGWSTFFSGGMLHTLPTDPWFLADVILIPFLRFPTVIGIKIFTLTEILFLGLSFLFVLRRWTVSSMASAVLLLLLFLGNYLFFLRSALGRPYPVAVAITILVVWAVMERRGAVLAVLLCVSTLLSQLFLFPLCVALVGAAWLQTLGERRAAFLLCTASLAGVSAGFLLHPASADYLRYILTVFTRIPLLSHRLRLGMEMNNADPSSLYPVITATGTVILGSVFLAHHVPSQWRKVHLSGLSYLWALTLLLFPAYLFWGRGIDFLWPIIILSIGRMLSLQPDIAASIVRYMFPKRFASNIGAALIVFLCATEMWIALSGFRKTSHLSSFTIPSTVPAESHILTVDWDLFAPCVSSRPDLVYATGIDASFTYLANPALAELLGYTKSSKGLMNLDPSFDVNDWLTQTLSHSPSDYIALRRTRHPQLIYLLQQSPTTQQVMVNREMAVFKVVRTSKIIP